MRLDSLISKINVCLSLSAIALVAYLALVRMQPYSPLALGGENLKVGPSELINKEPAFDEGLFKKKPLFSQFAKINIEQGKNAFILLGVSLGDKNLAMLRDTAENKDYYCTEGDTIGNFRVKQILKEKVILESAGTILEITR